MVASFDGFLFPPLDRVLRNTPHARARGTPHTRADAADASLLSGSRALRGLLLFPIVLPYTAQSWTTQPWATRNSCNTAQHAARQPRNRTSRCRAHNALRALLNRLASDALPDRHRAVAPARGTARVRQSRQTQGHAPSAAAFRRRRWCRRLLRVGGRAPPPPAPPLAVPSAHFAAALPARGADPSLRSPTKPIRTNCPTSTTVPRRIRMQAVGGPARRAATLTEPNRRFRRAQLTGADTCIASRSMCMRVAQTHALQAVIQVGCSFQFKSALRIGCVQAIKLAFCCSIRRCGWQATQDVWENPWDALCVITSCMNLALDCLL
eukprot:356298-Chlamydomonas_euryale.AAC.10